MVGIVGALEYFWWIIFIVLDIIFIVVTMQVARSKGLSPLFWGLLACFLPLFSIIIVLLLPSRGMGD
jgi:hypothetical protein